MISVTSWSSLHLVVYTNAGCLASARLPPWSWAICLGPSFTPLFGPWALGSYYPALGFWARFWSSACICSLQCEQFLILCFKDPHLRHAPKLLQHSPRCFLPQVAQLGLLVPIVVTTMFYLCRSSLVCLLACEAWTVGPSSLLAENLGFSLISRS